MYLKAIDFPNRNYKYLERIWYCGNQGYQKRVLTRKIVRF
jgi:hypothetical protein